MQLQELFNDLHGYRVTVDNSESFEATFEANGRRIEVQLNKVPRETDAWEFSFHQVRVNDDGEETVTHDVTGSGDEFRVLGTAFKIARDFAREHNPKIITFTSEKNDRSRTSVYSRLVDRFFKDGWKKDLDKKSSDYRDYFTLTKED